MNKGETVFDALEFLGEDLIAEAEETRLKRTPWWAVAATAAVLVLAWGLGTSFHTPPAPAEPPLLEEPELLPPAWDPDTPIGEEELKLDNGISIGMTYEEAIPILRSLPGFRFLQLDQPILAEAQGISYYFLNNQEGELILSQIHLQYGEATSAFCRGLRLGQPFEEFLAQVPHGADADIPQEKAVLYEQGDYRCIYDFVSVGVPNREGAYDVLVETPRYTLTLTYSGADNRLNYALLAVKNQPQLLPYPRISQPTAFTDCLGEPWDLHYTGYAYHFEQDQLVVEKEDRSIATQVPGLNPAQLQTLGVYLSDQVAMVGFTTQEEPQVLLVRYGSIYRDNWTETELSLPGPVKQVFLGAVDQNLSWLAAEIQVQEGVFQPVLYRSDTQGETMTPVEAQWEFPAGARLTGASFPTDTLGFLSFRGSDQAPIVQYTWDGGRTWATSSLPALDDGLTLTPMPVLWQGFHCMLPIHCSETGEVLWFQSDDQGQSFH